MTRTATPFRHAPSLLLAALLATGTAAPVTAAALPPPALSALLSAPRLDGAGVARLHAQAVLAGDLPAVRARLDGLARSAATPRERTMALLVAAALDWRSGSPDTAERAVDAALALAPTADALLLKAELIDAGGRAAAAADWYRQARDATPDPVERARLDLRLAMIAALRRPETLADHAATQPAAARGRTAFVLALLGRPKAALALDGAATSVVQHLRHAEWAIAAGETAVARDQARRAFAAAPASARDDRRYALALLVEACRDAGDLPAALALLTALPQGADVVAARVDLLLELGRTDAALAVIGASSDPALRQRLVGVLDLAGRDTDAIAEYRRLIAAHPEQPQWYGALAATYLARGDTAQAQAVFAALFAANRGREDVLIAGARQMIGMGLQAQAVAMLEGGSRDPAAARATRLFLFETYADRGDDAAARRELAALRAGETDPALLADVADGYERLGQPADALAILRALEARGAAAGYDRQVRMAELAAAAGDGDAALARWRRLWAMATLPARRSYAERQIVRLARGAGRLGALAAEIETRLRAGTLHAGEIDLLVAIRLAQDDRAAAVDAVRRYAAASGQSEVASLEQLAALYARMRDYDRFGEVVQRLAVVDPANRDAHLRQAILNTLRLNDGPVGPARVAALDRLIAQLDEARNGSAHQFRATVYTLAALDEQALDQLRAGLAAQPDDGDALLRFTAALKKAGRLREAVAILHQAALHARTPAAFATAIDGSIDLLADAPAAAAGSGGVAPAAALLLAERLVLERIAATGADDRLLALLADIGQARADYDLQVRALDASLATAGDQRASVLRELVTLNAGSGDADASGGPAIGDPARRIVYGRRLIALGHAYPADFYADLGRALLARNDGPGAERAFAMMNDLGGLVNVDAVKGDAYAAAGHAPAALAAYGRALLRDRDDAALIVKASILRERTGRADLARHWYWQGLRGLIARQPLVAADGQDDARVDMRRNFATLAEGLVSTWPDDPAARQLIVDGLRRLFTDSFAQVDAARPGTLAGHPRLALTVALGHRIADARDDGGATAGWDAGLDRVFAGDADYRRDAAFRRHLAGIGAAPAPAAGSDWPVDDLRIQAADTGNAMLQLALALRAADWATMRALTDAALAHEVAWRASVARTGGAAGRPPMYQPMALMLLDRLPADRFRTIVLAPLDASPVRDAVLFDIFRALPDRYAALEAVAGRPLLASDRLVDLTVARGNTPLGFSARAMRRRAAPDGWLDRFSADQLLTLYRRLTDPADPSADSSLTPGLVARLLSRPLDTARQAALAAAMTRDVGVVRDPGQRSVGPLLPLLLQLDTAPANRALLLQVARAAADRYPDGDRLPVFLQAWFAGDMRAAYAALVALGAAVDARYRGGTPIDAIVATRFATERQAEINAFLDLPAPTAAQAAAFYERFIRRAPDTPPPGRSLAYYRRLTAADPASPVYRTGLLTLLAEQRQWAPFATALRGAVAADPADQDAATTLAFAWLLTGQTAQAEATARAANVDIADPGTIVAMLNRARAARGGDVAALFPAVYGAYAAQAPTAPVVVAVRARRGAGPAGDFGEDRTLRPLRDAAAGDPAAAPAVLRGLWRTSAAPSDEGDDGARDALVQALVAAGSGDGPDAALLLRPAMTAELEHDLSVMAPDAQAGQQPLYDLVARGLVANGAGARRLQDGLAALERTGDGGGAHGFHLLVALADRQPASLDAAGRAALVRRLRAMPVRSLSGRIVLTRVMAAAADLPAAAGLLRAATAQLLYPLTPLDTADDAGARIVAALDRWPDRAAARALHAELSQQVAAGAAAPGAGLPPLGATAPAP